MSESDDTPRRAKGSKQWRVTRAIHLHFTSGKSYGEIAEELGVSERTVRRYVNEPPAKEVQAQLDQQAAQVRMAAFSELKRQLREAGERSRTAEQPVKVWEGEDGELQVEDVENEDGKVVKRVPIPADLVMGPDEQARFYARKEAREVLDMLIDLVGAAEPDQLELSGEVEGSFSEEQLASLKNDITDAFGSG